MIELPRLSVIVPVYNEKDTLRIIIDRLHSVPIPMEIIAINEDVKEAGEFLARAAIQAIKEPHLPPMQGLDVPKDDSA